MKRRWVLSLYWIFAVLQSMAQEVVSIVDGRFFYHERPFVVRGINWHKAAWQVSPRQRADDLKRLQQYGLNTLRIVLPEAATISQAEELLELAGKHNLIALVSLPDTLLSQPLAREMMRTYAEDHRVLAWEIRQTSQQPLTLPVEVLQPLSVRSSPDAQTDSKEAAYVSAELHPLRNGWTSYDRLFEALPNVYVRTQEWLQEHFRYCRKNVLPFLIVDATYPRDRGFGSPGSTTTLRDAFLSFLSSQMAEGREDSPFCGYILGEWYGSWSESMEGNPLAVYAEDTTTLKIVGNSSYLSTNR